MHCTYLQKIQLLILLQIFILIIVIWTKLFYIRALVNGSHIRKKIIVCFYLFDIFYVYIKCKILK